MSNSTIDMINSVNKYLLCSFMCLCACMQFGGQNTASNVVLRNNIYCLWNKPLIGLKLTNTARLNWATRILLSPPPQYCDYKQPLLNLPFLQTFCEFISVCCVAREALSWWDHFSKRYENPTDVTTGTPYYRVTLCDHLFPLINHIDIKQKSKDFNPKDYCLIISIIIML